MRLTPENDGGVIYINTSAIDIFMELFGFSVVLVPERGSYSAWCPELDVASQGKTMDKAVASLKEAIELHLECLSASEIREIRQRGTRFVTTVEVPLPA